MMPQKKNPDPLELVRGKTGRAIGHLAGWLATMKGLPSGYNKDLQEDKEAVFDAEATLAGSLEAVAIVVDGLTRQHGTCRAGGGGLLLATDVADYLVGEGRAVRRAHELVGAMTRRLLPKAGISSRCRWPSGAATRSVRVRRHRAGDHAASVEARRTPQSTHPAPCGRPA